MKYAKIVLINVCLIVILLIIIDFVWFEVEKKRYIQMYENSGGFFKSSQVVHYDDYVIPSLIQFKRDWQVIDKNNKENAILLTGCSYTYGSNLLPTQNFSYYLAKETGLTVYNWGIEGGSIQHTLYLSQQKDFIKDFPNVNLIIYTFIGDHINRINEFLKCEIYCPYCNLRMEEKNGKYIKMSEWYRIPSGIFLFRMVLRTITSIKNSKIFFEHNSTKFAKMVNQTKKNLQSYYPDAKFVFLFYFPGEKKEWINKLDKDILVMSTSDYTKVDLSAPQYRHNLDTHPTELVWKDTVPDLVRKLKEIGYLK